jgi:hypothetical protein
MSTAEAEKYSPFALFPCRGIGYVRPKSVFSELALMAADALTDERGFVPANGFVPDAATAVAIAEAVLIPIFGRAQIESERPFSASLEGGNWTVVGHLPPDCLGGAAEVIIDRSTGRVIRVLHWQ